MIDRAQFLSIIESRSIKELVAQYGVSFQGGDGEEDMKLK